MRSFINLHSLISQELRRQLELKAVKFNTEFEVVETLTEMYANASKEDRLDILDDLEFYLHQVRKMIARAFFFAWVSS